MADEGDATVRATDSQFGLNFSVWSSDERRGRRVEACLQAGPVDVNDAYVAAWGSVGVPMGGMRGLWSRSEPRRSRPRTQCPRRFRGLEDPQAPSGHQVVKKE
ncbi:aldehyde dehydrogenase family protein [Streptomyces parvulus]|uniref:aldehyde dehydrogenase family protein n=1 Tax=Streptomyces parvulus TaxID=146923 RepID=UPI0037D03C36